MTHPVRQPHRTLLTRLEPMNITEVRLGDQLKRVLVDLELGFC